MPSSERSRPSVAVPLAAFAIGALFSTGLILSGMTNPAKVQNFLALFGPWDPSLAFVMAGALGVAAIGYRVVLRREGPLGDAAFHLPDKNPIDGDLLVGSALFGIGWGLAGLCPGPGLAVLPMAPLQAATFLLGLVGGLLAGRRYRSLHIRRNDAARTA